MHMRAEHPTLPDDEPSLQTWVLNFHDLPARPRPRDRLLSVAKLRSLLELKQHSQADLNYALVTYTSYGCVKTFVADFKDRTFSMFVRLAFPQ